MDDPKAEGRRIEQLLDDVRELAPGPAWERVEELVRRMLGLYAEGLARLLAHARAGGAGATFDDLIAGDELVSSLLLLHGLHPQPPAERVSRALAAAKSVLGPRGARAELVAVDGGVARVRFEGSEALQHIVRRAIEDAAPELLGVEIEAPLAPVVQLRISGAAS
jgi:hypothetical protein